MAFNLESGDPIAIIKGGPDNNEIVHLNANYEEDIEEKSLKKKHIPHFKSVDLPKNALFQQYPDTKRERDCGMIVGASGSGKSYYVNQYMKNYKKAYKKRDIYFFSVIKEDKSIDPDIVKRVRLDDTWISETLSIEDVENSLCVFDDVEQIKDIRIKQEVFRFINEILTAGRHTNTSIFLIVHYANNKSYLRDMLNEMNSFTFFPRSMNRALVYLLENYVGLDKQEIKKIKLLKTRWATVFKNYPNCVLTERNLFMLSDTDLD